MKKFSNSRTGNDDSPTSDSVIAPKPQKPEEDATNLVFPEDTGISTESSDESELHETIQLSPEADSSETDGVTILPPGNNTTPPKSPTIERTPLTTLYNNGTNKIFNFKVIPHTDDSIIALKRIEFTIEGSGMELSNFKFDKINQNDITSLNLNNSLALFTATQPLNWKRFGFDAKIGDNLLSESAEPIVCGNGTLCKLELAIVFTDELEIGSETEYNLKVDIKKWFDAGDYLKVSFSPQDSTDYSKDVGKSIGAEDIGGNSDGKCLDPNEACDLEIPATAGDGGGNIYNILWTTDFINWTNGNYIKIHTADAQYFAY